MSLEKDIKQKNFRNYYNKLIVNIMFTTNSLVAKYSKILKPYGLTTQQYNVLKILQKSHPKPVTVNYIFVRMVGRMSNISKLIHKLIVKDLVENIQGIV